MGQFDLIQLELILLQAHRIPPRAGGHNIMGLQATATMLPKPFRKDWPKALEHDSYIGHGIDHMKLSVAAIVHIF